jgi:hypothetical protein
MKQKFFPQGIAIDDAFCNREKERLSLKLSIEQHEHIVLVAPRRYGKTSLVTQVLNENNFPGTSIDFFYVLTQEEVTRSISQGVSRVMSMLLPPIKQLTQDLINSILAANPKLNINLFGQRLEISTQQTTEKSISELLLALDQFAAQLKTNCVIIFDEFQQIGELKENHAVEAAIRHAVERSQYVSYIFCGSKQHLLNEMFSDRSRPLYHLCDLMAIGRIEANCYYKFINKMAIERWQMALEDDVLVEITDLTENHPYYINALCRRLWKVDTAPNLANVRNAWDDYVNQQRDWMMNDLSMLSLNRRKVILALAQKPFKEVQGHEFSLKANLSPAAIKRCIVDLQKMDMIYINNEKCYAILDPAMAYFIRQHLIGAKEV